MLWAVSTLRWDLDTSVSPIRLSIIVGDANTLFFDGSELCDKVSYIDFAEPFTLELRSALQQQCESILPSNQFSAAGTYACTQGPRLESAAEICRIRRDGADIVGMTLMPEAALARELKLRYASICAVANWAAGIDPQGLVMEEVLATLEGALSRVELVVAGVIKCLSPPSP
mgnify:CR=1 FL=1